MLLRQILHHILLYLCVYHASWLQRKWACRSKHREWQLMPLATRQCCDYKSAGEEAKCWDCYSQCFASARTQIVIIYIFRKVNALVETFCKVTNLKVEKHIAVSQVYGHYLICFLAWVVIFTKKPLNNLHHLNHRLAASSLYTVWHNPHVLPNGFALAGSEQGQDYWCLNTNEKSV